MNECNSHLIARKKKIVATGFFSPTGYGALKTAEAKKSEDGGGGSWAEIEPTSSKEIIYQLLKLTLVQPNIYMDRSSGGTVGWANARNLQLLGSNLIVFMVHKSYHLSAGVILLLIFSVVLGCHYLVLEGFDQHFQASVHFSLTRSVI